MKWPGTGFTVELPCGERVYMGTLEEMAQREASGIYGPDPCAEAETVTAPVGVVSTNGHVTTERKFQVGDKVRIHGGLPWTVAGDDTNKTPVRDSEPAYELTQTRTNSSRGYHYVYESVRFAYESELVPVA